MISYMKYILIGLLFPYSVLATSNGEQQISPSQKEINLDRKPTAEESHGFQIINVEVIRKHPQTPEVQAAEKLRIKK